MAAIHFRGFIFFSALIPTIIYTLVASILVWVLSTRIESDQFHFLWILLASIVFSAVFKMGKDAPLLIKNAIVANKFHVTNEDRVLLKKLERTQQIVHFFRYLFLMAMTSSFVMLGTAWFILEFFDQNLWQVYLAATTVLPIVVFICLFSINIKAYLSIERDINCITPSSFEQAVRRWFILPEAFSFLVINLSILIPLYNISVHPFSDQLVTIVIVCLVTTAFLFLSINSDAKNQVSGLILYGQREDAIKPVDLSSIRTGPKAYQIKNYSYWKWMPVILVFQLMLFATTQYVFVEQWFSIFVFLLEIFWLVLFSVFRYSVVLDTYKKIIYFRYPSSLEETQQYGSIEANDV